MMKKLKKFMSPVTIVLFVVALTSIFNYKVIFAASDSDLSSTDQNTVNSAPTGLLMSNYFTIKNPTNNSSDSSFRFKSNSAFISDNNKVLVLAHGTSTNSADNTTGLNGVKNRTGSYGAVWSNLDNAYFEAAKPQTISAWLSFGSGGGDETINGQGMALVLQNNADGSTEMGAGQEGLGVYGYDKSTAKLLGYSLSSASDVAKTAVQNSIALEFDTQRQDSTASNSYPPIMYSMDAFYSYYSTNSFDTKNVNISAPSGFPDDTSLGAGGGFGHIALTYPSDPKSYAATDTGYGLNGGSSPFSPFEKGFSLFHIHRKETFLTNDTDDNNNPIVWHHLTFRWMPSADLKTATISYSYNDKDIDGSINTKHRIDDNITVDMNQLGTITKDSKIYWGFTGANNNTNSNVASKLVSVESIPDLVNASVKTTITDKTLNKVMYDDPDSGLSGDDTDRKVAAGDNLELDYKLTYQDGREDWKDIAAKIKLPKNITYNTDSSNIGTIKYENGDSEPIPASAITTDSTGLQTINYTFLQNLGNISATSKIADIVINGVAVNDTKADISVEDQPAIFTGSNNIVSTSTPKFTIMYKKDWTLNLANSMTDPITLLYQQDNATLNLDTKLNYNGKTSPDFATNDKIHYQISLGSHNFTYETTVSADSDNLSDQIPLRKVIEDAGLDFWTLFPNNSSQKITVTATDDDGIISNSATYNVNVEPNHLLEVNADTSLQFQTVNYLSPVEYIKRASNYDVTVTSYRNPWMLQVSATELTNGDAKFNGDIVNKSSNGTTVLTNNNATIASDDTSYDKETTTSIASLNKWTTDTGLLLKKYGLSSSKQYSGTLTWTVMDYNDSL